MAETIEVRSLEYQPSQKSPMRAVWQEGAIIRVTTTPFCTVKTCNGQLLGQPRKQNHDKMSRKCPQNVRNSSKLSDPKLLRSQCFDVFRHFWPIWSFLLFGNPVQCVPVTSQHFSKSYRAAPSQPDLPHPAPTPLNPSHWA